MASPLNDAIGQSFDPSEEEYWKDKQYETDVSDANYIPPEFAAIGDEQNQLPEWMQKYGSHISDRVAADAIDSGYATGDMSPMQMFGAKMKMGLNPFSENSAFSYVPGTSKKWSEGGEASQAVGGLMGFLGGGKKYKMLKNALKILGVGQALEYGASGITGGGWNPFQTTLAGRTLASPFTSDDSGEYYEEGIPQTYMDTGIEMTPTVQDSIQNVIKNKRLFKGF